MSVKLIVQNDDDLVNYLVNNTDYTKKKIKSILKYHHVKVNKQTILKLPYTVKKNDQIILDLNAEELPFKIIYEDDDIIVINKKAGLLTIATNKEKEDTLYHQVRLYALKHHFKAFIINRLDQDTSGLVMFAKNERIKELYQNDWNNLVLKRGYVALVYGCINNDGVIDNYLYEGKNTFVHSSNKGKRAITNYRILKKGKNYTLLDIDIKTGRKNQIRVHLSEMGHPIVGDKKYGGHPSSLKRMALHNYILVVINPKTKKIQTFEAPYNHSFDKLLDD